MTEFFLLDLHLKRLNQSANDFVSLDYHFHCIPSAQDIGVKLQGALEHVQGPQKVRLLLDSTGDLQIEHTPISGPYYTSLDEAAAAEPLFNVVLDIQATPLDLFVSHKTTRRTAYDNARLRMGCDWNANHERGIFDVVLWNEKGEVTETSIANLAVLVDRGDGKTRWVTPSTDCGLLPGVFRQAALDRGEIQQGHLMVNDLIIAHQVGRSCASIQFAKPIEYGWYLNHEMRDLRQQKRITFITQRVMTDPKGYHSRLWERDTF